MVAAAAHRFVTLLAAIVGARAIRSPLLELRFGPEPARSVAAGPYLVGCELL